MVQTGLLVKTAADELEQVMENLNSIEGLKIHGITDDNSIVAVLETGSVDDEAAISSGIAKIKGVLGVSLAYHHFSDEGKE